MFESNSWVFSNIWNLNFNYILRCNSVSLDLVSTSSECIYMLNCTNLWLESKASSWDEIQILNVPPFGSDWFYIACMLRYSYGCDLPCCCGHGKGMLLDQYNAILKYSHFFQKLISSYQIQNGFMHTRFHFLVLNPIRCISSITIISYEQSISVQSMPHSGSAFACLL